jgi:signal transduction histidine kinase
VSAARNWRSWWYRLGSVRLRSALAATAVVVCAGGLVAIGLILTARGTLTDNVDATAQQRAEQVVAAIRVGDATRLDETLQGSPGDQTIVQILTPAGQVVAASAAIEGQPSLTRLRPGTNETVWDQSRLPLRVEDPFRILATGVPTDDGGRIVVVAQSLGPVNESTEAITEAAVVAMPLLAAVGGVATFLFVGRSLQPVEHIRRRVATITSRDLHARVPVPRAHDEIAALAETMNAMLDRLQASTEAQRRFIADASHELRSPLTTLQVGLDVLAANDQVPRHQVQRLQGEAQRLGQLVGDLLLLARIDEHAQPAVADDVDLDDLAYHQRDRLQAQHPQLRVLTHIEPARVRADADHLGRAIRNLADNAARHARTEVTLTVTVHNGSAELRVIDDGPGIGPADRDRVFDRFIRLDDSRTRADGGAGLGLAIAREIVQAHGGTLVIDDTDDSGACLLLRLPATEPTRVGPNPSADRR